MVAFFDGIQLSFLRIWPTWNDLSFSALPVLGHPFLAAACPDLPVKANQSFATLNRCQDSYFLLRYSI